MQKTRAIAEGRTMFEMNVMPPGISHVTGKGTKMLKLACENRKMGGSGRKDWRAGAYRGLPSYTLTLEERATCPSCPIWDDCYGNNMPFATRFDASDGGGLLVAALRPELDVLDALHPDGYSIRLHVLGDFFSVEYINFWHAQLHRRPGLMLFGYTHVGGTMRAAIDKVFDHHGFRFNILQSDGLLNGSGRPVALLETSPGADQLPMCPYYQEKVEDCLDCGLCTMPWIRGVRWRIH